LVTVTLAPDTAAPDGSRIWPRNDPVVPCENAGDEANNTKAAASSNKVARMLLYDFEFIPSPEATHFAKVFRRTSHL
jgi:hypothetical protein